MVWIISRHFVNQYCLEYMTAVRIGLRRSASEFLRDNTTVPCSGGVVIVSLMATCPQVLASNDLRKELLSWSDIVPRLCRQREERCRKATAFGPKETTPNYTV